LAPAIVTALNIFFLLLLYLFLWQTIKAIYIDIYERPLPYSEAKEILDREHKKRGAGATLEVVKGDSVSPGRIYPLADTVTIGRSTENEIVLRDAFVSHQHARILKKRDTYYIMDLGSTNGTLVGRNKISELTPLRPGSKIRIGNTTLKFKE
jgi:hypothetical protein